MWKRLERSGRRLLVRLLATLLGVERRGVRLPLAPRILVVRLDERVGNLLLLTPLLASLRARFPHGGIDVLVSTKGRPVLERHPAVSALLPFRKRALFAADGPLYAMAALRRRRYDLAIDAGNPTDPSFTHAALVRFSGARHTIGPATGPFASLYSAPAAVAGTHEIDLRLALLAPLGDGPALRRPSLAPPGAPTPPVARLLAELEGRAMCVVNVGARLAEKRLPAAAYAEIATAAAAAGFAPVLAWGPAEQELAADAAAACPAARLAPPTDLHALATLLHAAAAVVSCDTGPMHLAVALGVPTCGLFVTTPPERYGYVDAPHRALDLRGRDIQVRLGEVAAWLGGLAGAIRSAR